MTRQWKACLLTLSLFVLSELCVAGIRPSFDPEHAAWNASDIIVVSATPRGGVFTVLETLKGKLEPGTEINIPELAPKRNAKPISKYSFDAVGYRETDLNVRVPKQVTGTRMLLFLSRLYKSEENGAAAGMRWWPASGGDDVKSSTVWIDAGRAYCFIQKMNPGASGLSRCWMDEAKLRARLLEVINTQRKLFDLTIQNDMRLRAEALSQYIKSDLHRDRADRIWEARDFALGELAKCGPAGLPIIREMLNDETLLTASADFVDAFVEVGGTGPELTAMLRRELEFWKSIGPTLTPGWWNDCSNDNCTDDSRLRNRYTQTLHMVSGLRRMRFVGGIQAASELRDFWRSLPQLDQHGALDQMARECDEYIRTARRDESLLAAGPLPSLGDELPPRLLKLRKEKGLQLCMTHSGQLDPCVTVTSDGVEYNIAYDEESRCVTYIETYDKAFTTSRGLKIGDQIPVSEKDVEVFPGWIVFAAPMPDEWQPIIGGPDGVVKLKNGDLLKVWSNPSGSSAGLATITGFAKGPQRPKQFTIPSLNDLK